MNRAWYIGAGWPPTTPFPGVLDTDGHWRGPNPDQVKRMIGPFRTRREAQPAIEACFAWMDRKRKRSNRFVFALLVVDGAVKHCNKVKR